MVTGGIGLIQQLCSAPKVRAQIFRKSTVDYDANWFAYVALLSWPLVALWLFHARPVNQATIWTILGAQLLLPVGAAIKFEMVPAFDKYTISNLAAFVGCLLVVRRSPRIWYGFGLAGVLMLMYLASPFITAELNGDPIFLGNRTIPGEGHYDALSAVVGQFLFFLPFFLGRQVMRTSADHEEILRVLVIAGLLYSVPMLFEVRMSPQLHTLLYGYFPHAFDQQYRDGGFRPVDVHGPWPHRGLLHNDDCCSCCRLVANSDRTG